MTDSQTALDLDDQPSEILTSQPHLRMAKRLPFGGEFSPDQVDLAWLLEAVEGSGGSREQLVERIRDHYFSQSAAGYPPKERLIQQAKRAGNVVIGMKSYGLIVTSGRELALTQLGKELREFEFSEARYEALARHILVRLHGLSVLESIQAILDRNETVTKKSLADQLRHSGFTLPQATTHHLILLKWLRQADILPAKGYRIDFDGVGKLLGTSASVVSELDELSQQERVFLRALGRMVEVPDQWLKVSSVIQYAQELYSVRFPEDQWRSSLLTPLEKKGWIELESGTRGRGAKSGRIRATKRLESPDVRTLLEEDAPDIPAELKKMLRRPLADILVDLQSTDTNVKGRALELLALRMMQLLDLQYRSLRLRSVQTGGAEVDLVVEGTRLVFTRWQIQCKNTRQVSLDDLAKEVGLALLLKSQVVMMVTTGRFGSAVRTYAERVNETSSLQVILIGRQVLDRMAAAGPDGVLVLIKTLNEKAEQALRQKATQILVEL